jgi:hypothetical protein
MRFSFAASLIKGGEPAELQTSKKASFHFDLLPEKVQGQVVALYKGYVLQQAYYQ